MVAGIVQDQAAVLRKSLNDFFEPLLKEGAVDITMVVSVGLTLRIGVVDLFHWKKTVVSPTPEDDNPFTNP